MKRILTLVCALALLLSCSSAFAATQFGPTEPKSWLEDTSPVTLDMYVNFNWWTADWSDPVAQAITEQTGVSVNVITPVADDDTQLILMINSGEVPDIILTELGDTSLNQMILDSGIAAPLDELAQTYAPEMFDNCDPDVWNGYVQEDGHTYYLVNFNTADYYQEMALEFNQLIQANQPVILMREDYYQEIGSPDISTPDKFFDALSQMAANHPDKIAYYEGDSNVSAPNNADVGTLATYFGVPLYCEDEEGNITQNYRSEEWLNTVKYANKLARAGLYTTDSFIDDDATQTSKKFNGDVICYTWTAIEHEMEIEDSRYIVVEPWDSYTQYRTGTGWCASFINANSEKKDRAIRFMSFMNSYEGLLAYCGFEAKDGETYSGDPMVGPHYYIDENGKPCQFAEFTKAIVDDSTVQPTSGATMYWWFGSSVWNNLSVWDANDAKYAYLNEQFGPHVVYRPDFASMNMAPAGDSNEATILAKYKSIYNSYLADIVFAETDEAFDAAVNAFYTAMDDIGIAELEAYFTQAHKAVVEG